MKFIGTTLNKNEIEITPSEGKDAVSLALKKVKLIASYDDGSMKTCAEKYGVQAALIEQ